MSGALSLKEQVKVKDILISHSHLDHTCTLPFLIDNNFSAPGFSLRIYAIPEVIASMKNHLFNNHTWPDFTCLPNDLTPVLKLVEIEPEEPFVINGLTIRAVHVSHIVPTTGFIVEDKKGAIAFSSDTGPTERFWELVNDDQEPEGRDHGDVVPQRAAGPGQRLRPPDPAHARPGARQAEEGRARLPLRRQAQAPRQRSSGRSRR